MLRGGGGGDLKRIPLIFLNHLKYTKQIWAEDSISTPAEPLYEKWVSLRIYALLQV